MKSGYQETSKIAVIKFFLLISCLYGTTDYCIPREISQYYDTLHGSKYIFLTNICLYLSVLCLIMGILVRRFKFKHIKEIYKHSVSVMLPLNGLVSILFWTLYTKDPAYLRDKHFIEKNINIDLFTDVCVHFFPFLSLFLESKGLILKRRNLHLFFYLCFTIFYYLLCLYYSKLNKNWVYPLLDEMSTKSRVMLFGASTVISICLYEGFMLFLSGGK